MADIKIITHKTYTYETSDGCTFDDEQEALEWQKALDDMKGVVMLDDKFNPTSNLYNTYLVHVNTEEELAAFNTASEKEGIAGLPAVGYYYYDCHTDEYKNAGKELERLLLIINKLDSRREAIS